MGLHEERSEVKPLAVSAEPVIAYRTIWVGFRPLGGAVAATPAFLENRVGQVGGGFGNADERIEGSGRRHSLQSERRVRSRSLTSG